MSMESKTRHRKDIKPACKN